MQRAGTDPGREGNNVMKDGGTDAAECRHPAVGVDGICFGCGKLVGNMIRKPDGERTADALEKIAGALRDIADRFPYPSGPWYPANISLPNTEDREHLDDDPTTTL